MAVGLPPYILFLEKRCSRIPEMPVENAVQHGPYISPGSADPNVWEDFCVISWRWWNKVGSHQKNFCPGQVEILV
jgi:hypothetical protein